MVFGLGLAFQSCNNGVTYAEMKEEEKGATCATAINFDWTTGATQAANTTLWYAINIADAKANKHKSSNSLMQFCFLIINLIALMR